MSWHRHGDESRVRPGVTPFKARAFAEVLRRRATPRKLILLECAVVRHAPFAGCGRPVWDLLPGQPWFQEMIAPAGYYRSLRAMSEEDRAAGRWPEFPRPCPFTPLTGHQAIEWLEDCADGSADDDRFVLAGEYFRAAEYAAEADRFHTPDDRRDELEIGYGVASWLEDLLPVRAGSWNVLDYYVANYPGQFYCWGGWRPLHPAHRGVALGLIHDILGHPLDRTDIDPRWRTSTAVALAAGMYRSRDFSAMPILADALQDAGCDDAGVLAHCRSERPHVRGCWVVDRVLGTG